MKKSILTLLLIALSFKAFAQVGIGTNAPNASAALELTSKTQGFLLPRMLKTQMEAIKVPAEGLMVYCLDCTPKGFHVYNGKGFINANTGEYLNAPDMIAAIVAASDIPAAGGTPSLADLKAVHVENVTGDQTAYEEAIARATPVPTKLRDLQGIVNFTNDAFYEIWEDSYSGGKNANGTLVSYEQLEATGVKHLHMGNLEFYQKDILLERDFSKPPTVAQVQAVIDKTTVIVDVTSATGRVWMDRNLGAKQAAISSTDREAYGDYYQWGRNTDGHEKWDSKIEIGPVQFGKEGSSFITTENDWLIEQNDKRWNARTEDNPLKTQYDPCPEGYRVPTITELNNELDSWDTKDKFGALSSPLKIPIAGFRIMNNGEFYTLSRWTDLWSSTVIDSRARRLSVGNISANSDPDPRAYGFSVRCIKEK